MTYMFTLYTKVSHAEDDRLAVLDPVAEKGNFFRRTTVPTAHMGAVGTE